MRQWVALLIAPAFVGACSLLYNPSNLGKGNPDASDAPRIDAPMTADAAIDAPPLADANPSMLSLDAVYPTAVVASFHWEAPSAVVIWICAPRPVRLLFVPTSFSRIQ